MFLKYMVTSLACGPCLSALYPSVGAWLELSASAREFPAGALPGGAVGYRCWLANAAAPTMPASLSSAAA